MEIQKSPRWRQLYPPKVSTATGSEKITWAMWAVGGAAKHLGLSSPLIRVLSVLICISIVPRRSVQSKWVTSRWSERASNHLSRPQICSTDLKSAFQASNLPLIPQTCPQTSNLFFRPIILPPDLKSRFNYLLGLIYSPSGRLEIHPVCPTGHWPFWAAVLLPLQYFTWSSEQDIGYSWPCAILGWLVWSNVLASG